MEFEATLTLHGKTATGIEVPPEVVEALGSGRRPAVVVTLEGHSYRSTIASMGGVHLIGVSAQERKAAGVAAGDRLTVRVELDTAPRTTAPPPDLAQALTAVPAARAFFDELPPSHQKAYVTWIESAKKAETRDRRVAEAVVMLQEKRRR